MKCYDLEVLDAKMSFFQPRDDFRSYVSLGKSHNLINDSIISKPRLLLCY